MVPAHASHPPPAGSARSATPERTATWPANTRLSARLERCQADAGSGCEGNAGSLRARRATSHATIAETEMCTPNAGCQSFDQTRGWRWHAGRSGWRRHAHREYDPWGGEAAERKKEDIVNAARAFVAGIIGAVVMSLIMIGLRAIGVPLHLELRIAGML